MGITTKNGTDYSAVNSHGLNGATNGLPLLASVYNADQADIQEAATQQMLAGILSGGVCTASGLTVTVPNGTTWFARSVWALNADSAQTMTNNLVNWIWGCADGRIRVTTGTYGYPSTFDGTTAVLLTKATASSGVITLLNSVQHLGRQVDHANRTITDGPLLIDYANAIVDASSALAMKVPVFTSADPSVPGTGVYLWYRSDLGALRASVSGTVTQIGAAASLAPVANPTSGSAATLNFPAGVNQSVTLTANCTLTFTAPPAGSTVTISLVQDATGSRTVTWPSSVKWGGSAPTLSTAANAKNVLRMYYDGTDYIPISAGGLVAGFSAQAV